MGLEHGARAGAVKHARNAGFAEDAHVGVERRAAGRDGFFEQLGGIALQGFGQGQVAGQGLEGFGQQHAAHVHMNAVVGAALVEVGHGGGNHGAYAGFHGHRVFFGNHAAVQLERDFAGHHIGVGAA